MKFFLDTANLNELRDATAWGIIDGVTTNPSLIAREGVPAEQQLRAICDIVAGDVSAPVVSTAADDMIQEGRALAKLHQNIVVKVPVNEQGIIALSALTRHGVRTNATLCFTPAQALIAAKAGAYLVSPFMGRVEDNGGSGAQLIEDIAVIYRTHGFETQILAASVRTPEHLTQAARAGAHVATLPFKFIQSLFHHPLTEKGLAQFLADYHKTFELTRA